MMKSGGVAMLALVRFVILSNIIIVVDVSAFLPLGCSTNTIADTTILSPRRQHGSSCSGRRSRHVIRLSSFEDITGGGSEAKIKPPPLKVCLHNSK